VKIYRIISVQFAESHRKGIKGFIFYGESGVGKTLMAKVLAYELSVPLFFVDSAVIARKHYGDSEQLLLKVFQEAERNRSIILFDDAESLFPDRRAEVSRDWNLDENNVIFHRLDTIDTSKCCVIMTTNILELLDKALLDRLYAVRFPTPELDTMLEIARRRCEEFGIKNDQVEKEIRARPEEFQSIRSVERLISEQYVNDLSASALEVGIHLGHPSFS
jgi:SpoVK/Ycf46/Vps4 family AAA+-type ATPase